MNEIRAVIIEDEFLNRNFIKTLIGNLNPSFTIVGEAENVSDGLMITSALKPDVVFLDIKMPDGSGFDFLRMTGKPEFEVVFITGFDEYAMQAFEFNALDYILKPIDTEKFRRVLDKVKARLDNSLSHVGNLRRIIKTYDTKGAVIAKIPIHHNNHVYLLELNELMHIRSENGCTLFFTFDGQQFTSSKKLAEFEFIILRFPNFIRINRGTFVNLNAIKSYTKGSDCSIILKDGTTFEVSRRRKTEILNALSLK